MEKNFVHFNKKIINKKDIVMIYPVNFETAENPFNIRCVVRNHGAEYEEYNDADIRNERFLDLIHKLC